jgi:hypothetical protein
MNRARPASLRSVIASFGNPVELSSPAPVTRVVVETGMFATAQCQKPDAVGASGS